MVCGSPIGHGDALALWLALETCAADVATDPCDAVIATQVIEKASELANPARKPSG